MTRERWERIAPLVDAVLDQPPERRVAFVAEISGSDAALAEELTRFVSADANQQSETLAASLIAAANEERVALMSERLRDAAVDLQAQLEASLGASYVVEREIGGGGMARVFVAEEPGLERKVVIKVLPPEMSEGISAERFAREIKLAASLQQANIVPVLAAGTAAGFPYYTMPFVEGRSLRDRLLREGTLPVNEAISILRDVARALAFAHSRGVIHRDIKPGNILLSDRTAVVTDFGIAKALGAAREAGRAGGMQDTLTQTGTLGTPAYMAPEQASGDPNLDHRADIYSFGCVAFELLTGKPPFVGTAPRHIIAAHLEETPRRVTELRAEVPVAVAQLVASCLEKDPSRRPQSADDVLLALDGAASEPLELPPRWSRRLTLVVSTVFLVAGMAAVASYYALRVSEPLTLAALPFRNVTGDTAVKHRSDGIGDEILDGMAKVKGLQIVGRIAAFRYKDQTGINAPDIRAVERELGARLLLTGTLREVDGRVTIWVQLSDSTSPGEIWSHSFPGSSNDLASITDEIVRQATDAVRGRFGKRIVPPPRAVSTAGTTNDAAYDQYLIGKEQLRRRGSDVEQAIHSFERAIDLDSNFARARAALASALELSRFFVDGPPEPLMARAVAEAHRALTVDSTLADAYFALGSVHAAAGEWEQANSYMRRAVEFDASRRANLGRQLVLHGHAAEAIEQLERARKLEPTSPTIAAWMAYAFFLEGNADSALAESERAIKLGPTLLGNANLGALLNLGLGRNDAARHLMDVRVGPGMTNAPYVYAKVGDTAKANGIIRELEARNPRPWWVHVAKAGVFLATGDTASALTALERSSRDTGPLWVYYIPLGDPAYDPVRKSRRFEALLRKANIEMRVVTNPRRGY